MTFQGMDRLLLLAHAPRMESRHRLLYLVNAAVLLCHQIDAAYWREWELFHLPGGIQLFVVLNAPLVLLIRLGVERLREPGQGRRISAALALAGLFAVVLHGAYLLAGDDGFDTSVSLLLLAATAVLSPWQLVRLRALARKPANKATAGPRPDIQQVAGHRRSLVRGE